MKKLLRKLTAVLLVMTLVVNASITVLGQEMDSSLEGTDMDGHWAAATMYKWIEAGYVLGYPDGTYRPDDPISRAEFITLVNRLMGYYVMEDNVFGDLTGSEWFYPQVCIAQGANYLEWKQGSTLEGNAPITREEVSALLSTIYEYDLSGGTDVLEVFQDYEAASPWSLPYRLLLIMASLRAI